MRLLIEIYPNGDDIDYSHRFEIVRNGEHDTDRVAEQVLDALLHRWLRRDGEAVTSGG